MRVYVCGVCVCLVCARWRVLFGGGGGGGGERGGGEEEEQETEKNEENTIQREMIKPKPESISAR